MSKNDTRPATLKQPRKMEVKVLIPWVIILVLSVFFTGLVLGWNARSEQTSYINAEVAAQLKARAPVKK